MANGCLELSKKNKSLEGIISPLRVGLITSHTSIQFKGVIMGCYNSIVINASVEQVWQKLRNFHDMEAWATGVINSCIAEGEASGTEIGSKRILNGVFRETLLGLDDYAKVLHYSIDDGPEAVSKDNVQGYIGKVQVFPVTENNSTFVLWTSVWESSAGGVAEFCNPIYRGLLVALKNTLESKS